MLLWALIASAVALGAFAAVWDFNHGPGRIARKVGDGSSTAGDIELFKFAEGAGGIAMSDRFSFLVHSSADPPEAVVTYCGPPPPGLRLGSWLLVERDCPNQGVTLGERLYTDVPFSVQIGDEGIVFEFDAGYAVLFDGPGGPQRWTVPHL